MPFDYEEYEAKCSQMTVEQLHKEWENYTRQIAGGATGTAISSMAVPFTAGVSLIGVGMSAPRIHNARKKREIIEKYLQSQNTTHNTRKRDILMPMAVSGVINSLTLGLAAPGADMIMEAGATHGVEMVVASEVGTKFATHAALDVGGQAFEEAHARHDKKKGEKKLAQAAQITVTEVPGPNGTMGKIYQAQVYPTQFPGLPGSSGHSSKPPGEKQYGAVAIPLPYSRPGTPQPPPDYSPPSSTPSSAAPSYTAPSYNIKLQNDAEISASPAYPPRPLPLPLQQTSTHSYLGPPYHQPPSTMQGALPHSYSAPLYASHVVVEQDTAGGNVGYSSPQQSDSVAIVAQSFAALSYSSSEPPSSVLHDPNSTDSTSDHPAVAKLPTPSSLPAQPVSPLDSLSEIYSPLSASLTTDSHGDVEEASSKPQTPLTSQDIHYPPAALPQIQAIAQHSYTGHSITEQPTQCTPQQQYVQSQHTIQSPQQQVSPVSPQSYHVPPVEVSNSYQPDSQRHSFVASPLTPQVTAYQYDQQSVHQQHSQASIQQYYAPPPNQQHYGQHYAQQQYPPPSTSQQFSQSHYTSPSLQQQYAKPQDQQHFKPASHQQQYQSPPPQQYNPPQTQQNYAPPPIQQHCSPPPSSQNALYPVQYQQHQQQQLSPLSSPLACHSNHQHQHHLPPSPSRTSSPGTSSYQSHQPYNPQTFIQPYNPQALAAATAMGTGQHPQQGGYGENIGVTTYNQPPIPAPYAGASSGAGGVGGLDGVGYRG